MRQSSATTAAEEHPSRVRTILHKRCDGLGIERELAFDGFDVAVTREIIAESRSSR